MRIRKLEISGFKSFVDRTIIHFDSDVVGVVGPNGCGKSNIVDAIRWTMGEQSAKHLRGRAMSDVIFGGSESRPGAGLAEVTITFDNSDPEMAAQLPLEYKDYAEIAVTRRLFRDGTSEYLVNKTQVRLKDVTDLFLGTGVGTKAYSIVEQGRIGLIVSARPEDRRMLIEEAAGITKYKHRKKQAEAKMDQTRQNLLRVGDIVSEIERSLGQLKRQAAKAERWLSYRRELDDLVLHESSHRLLEILVRTQHETAMHSEVAERAQAARAGLSAREAELEALRQEALSLEDAAEAAQNESFRAGSEVQACEAEITRSRDRLRSLDERRAAATKQQAELEVSAAAYAAEREGVTADLVVADEEEARESELALGEHERLEELRAGEREAEDEVQRIRKEHAEASSVVAAAEATLDGFERRVRELAARRNRLEDELATIGLEREELASAKALHASALGEVAARKTDAEAERARLEAELRDLRERAVELDRAVDHDKNHLAQKRNRLRALEELHERHEGVGAGVASILATKDETIVGLVADLLEAPAELTEALAGALGEEAQCVVVRDAMRGAALLDDLREGQKGRASILPRSVPFVAGQTNSPPICPDGTRYPLLIDGISFAPEDEPVARALIGDVLVVPSVAEALAARAAGWRGRAVTESGTLLCADGRLVGGQGDRLAAGMIEQKREIRELHASVAAAGEVVTARLAEQAALRSALAGTGAALDVARATSHEAEKALLAHEKDLHRAEGELATVEKREQQIRSELEELFEASSGADGEVQEARERLDVGVGARDAAEAAMDHAEMRAAEWRERVLGQQAIVTDRKVGLARLKERSKSLRETVERLARSCDELGGRIEQLDGERDRAARDAGRFAATVFLDREKLGGLVDAARVADAASGEARAKLDGARAVASEREQALRGDRNEASELVEAVQRHAMALERLGIEKTHLEEGVRERFRGLELARVVGDYHKRPPVDEAHRARITELGELIDRMGGVNLDAVREHEEASKRFEYYSTQKADLEKAIADLEKAIEQMNRECTRLFQQTFEGVNQNFRTVFPQMFRGGQAELRLTNRDDLLESGIEILAQPPGKKLGTIELMSGGEKALTAVALIFAIFQYKPSPFCILDEVDAPLDEANVARYNDAIRRMTDRSQFILITHIKRTMQSVDVLYGVTMQEPGVSKIVSVRVNETAARGRQETVAVA